MYLIYLFDYHTNRCILYFLTVSPHYLFGYTNLKNYYQHLPCMWPTQQYYPMIPALVDYRQPWATSTGSPGGRPLVWRRP